MMAHDYKEIDFKAVQNAVFEAKDQGVCCFGDIVSIGDKKVVEILAEQGLYFTSFYEAFGFLPVESENDKIPYTKNDFNSIAGDLSTKLLFANNFV